MLEILRDLALEHVLGEGIDHGAVCAVLVRNRGLFVCQAEDGKGEGGFLFGLCGAVRKCEEEDALFDLLWGEDELDGFHKLWVVLVVVDHGAPGCFWFVHHDAVWDDFAVGGDDVACDLDVFLRRLAVLEELAALDGDIEIVACLAGENDLWESELVCHARGLERLVGGEHVLEIAGEVLEADGNALCARERGAVAEALVDEGFVHLREEEIGVGLVDGEVLGLVFFARVHVLDGVLGQQGEHRAAERAAELLAVLFLACLAGLVGHCAVADHAADEGERCRKVERGNILEDDAGCADEIRGDALRGEAEDVVL
eukprot:comp22428_c0_seq2/m.54924 comp22428_c0_seq2/g.54924  ORF comp22428_c0_seq2/g.54924 comp22428_c0_seq2/m.54924 type:complete len:314 (+) comp22428_c0_seq2:3339-4280(+)